MQKIIECVPNFSEGQNSQVIEAIASAIRSTDGVNLVDVDPGASTNRTVYTFLGAPDAVVKAALNAATAAYNLIDMSKHKGEHPRLGALDVCPFIPVRGVEVEEAIYCAKKFAQKLAAALNIPVYLYGRAARWEHRTTVPQIRAGEYEGLAQKIKKEDWAPDYGPAEFIPQWGATMAGVRKFLIAYNVNLLATKEQAHRIALNIREQGRGPDSAGRLRCVQGIGWWLAEHNMAQVSLNLTDTDITPLHIAYEEVCKDAKELRLPVAGSEIVGLVPLQSLLKAAEFYIEKEDLFILEEDQKVKLAIDRLGLSSISHFNPKERIIEYRLPASGSESLVNLTTERFVLAVGGRSAAPGGGSVSALVGAMGAALGTMVGHMTYGKRQWEHLDSQMRKLLPIMHCGMKDLLPVVDQDTQAFNEYLVALRLPKATPEEVTAKDVALQSALKKTVAVPLGLATKVNSLWPAFKELALCGNIGTRSDLEVGARCLETSVWGAYYNVRINLKDIKDDTYRDKLSAEIEDAVTVAQTCCRDVLSILESREK